MNNITDFKISVTIWGLSKVSYCSLSSFFSLKDSFELMSVHMLGLNFSVC